jgi:hypothetical protein
MEILIIFIGLCSSVFRRSYCGSWIVVVISTIWIWNELLTSYSMKYWKKGICFYSGDSNLILYFVQICNKKATQWVAFNRL